MQRLCIGFWWHIEHLKTLKTKYMFSNQYTDSKFIEERRCLKCDSCFCAPPQPKKWADAVSAGMLTLNLAISYLSHQRASPRVFMRLFMCGWVLCLSTLPLLPVPTYPRGRPPLLPPCIGRWIWAVGGWVLGLALHVLGSLTFSYLSPPEAGLPSCLLHPLNPGSHPVSPYYASNLQPTNP